MGFVENMYVIGARMHLDRSSDSAHWKAKCSHCDSGTMLSVAVANAPEHLSEIGPSSVWLLCEACGQGAWAICNDQEALLQYPQSLPFEMPKHLSQEVERTWEEARQTFAANAFTSCALMCRKILFHIAVEEGLPEKNDRNRAPGFEECLDHLVEKEVITGRQRLQWVDSIRKWGNHATHDLAAVSRDTAEKAMLFTLFLLQNVYSYPALAPKGDEK